MESVGDGKAEEKQDRDVANVSENADGNYVHLYSGVEEVATVSEKPVPHISETQVVKDDVPKAVGDDSSVEENVDGKTVEENASGENTKLTYLYGRPVVLMELCVNIF